MRSAGWESMSYYLRPVPRSPIQVWKIDDHAAVLLGVSMLAEELQAAGVIWLYQLHLYPLWKPV